MDSRGTLGVCNMEQLSALVCLSVFGAMNKLPDDIKAWKSWKLWISAKDADSSDRELINCFYFIELQTFD